MADRPILFSAPMVRALLAGAKTQTRRLIDFKGIDEVMDFVKVATDTLGRPVYEMKGSVGQHIAIPAGKHLQDHNWSPRIGVGDRLYVREHWRTTYGLDWAAEELGRPLKPREFDPKTTAIEYLADGDRELAGKDRRAMHMPRWASRLTLTVTDVRVERLQDISETDAAAEGWPAPEDRAKTGIAEIKDAYPIGWYAWLWDSINGQGAWNANPFVVAYSFSVQQGNIDQIAKVAA